MRAKGDLWPQHVHVTIHTHMHIQQQNHTKLYKIHPVVIYQLKYNKMILVNYIDFLYFGKGTKENYEFNKRAVLIFLFNTL